MDTAMDKCAGALPVDSHGTMQLISAKWNMPDAEGGRVDVDGSGVVEVFMTGRAYLADRCRSCSAAEAQFMAGCAEKQWAYSPTEYSALQLLDKSWKFTIDLSGVHCGCNAALYFVAMRQNMEKSKCEDYYCDANKVCGVSCVEIDIMEANRHAWATTLHAATDGSGVGRGLGAGKDDAWSSSDYGPGGRCIDTNRPFQVEARFHTDGGGGLRALEVVLTQPYSSCPLQLSHSDYWGMKHIEEALRAGMTPVMSLWGVDADMDWLDDGVCSGDENPRQCKSIRFSEFAIEPVPAEAPLTPPPAATPAPSSAAPPPSAPVPPVVAAPAPSARDAWLPAAPPHPTGPPHFATPAQSVRPATVLATSAPSVLPARSAPPATTAAPTETPVPPSDTSIITDANVRIEAAPAQFRTAAPPPAPTPPPAALPRVAVAPAALPQAAVVKTTVAPIAAPGGGGSTSTVLIVCIAAVVLLLVFGGVAMAMAMDAEPEQGTHIAAVQRGDIVRVKQAFVAKGRMYGSTKVPARTEGKIRKVEDGQLTVTFNGYLGLYRVPIDEKRIAVIPKKATGGRDMGCGEGLLEDLCMR